MYRPKISIIIPTFNRASSLIRTIDSFVNQNYPKELLEIIIADNNSSDSTENDTKKYLKFLEPKFFYFKETRQGVHFARNSASKFSSGEILYFTDDDMEADPELLIELCKIFEFDSGVASATGRVLPIWELEPPKWIKELCYNYLLSLNDPPEEFIISRSDCGVFSCHQAIKRDVFLQSGGFNPENTSGEWIGDGETGLNIKIRELGYKFGYNGKSIIYHIIPPHRMTQSYLNKRLANQGNCDSYTKFREKETSNLEIAKNIVIYCLGIVLSITLTFFYFVLGSNKWRLKMSRIFYYINRMKYDFRLSYDENWRELVLRRNWLEEEL